MTYTYNYLQFQKLRQKFLIIILTNQCISIVHALTTTDTIITFISYYIFM